MGYEEQAPHRRADYASVKLLLATPYYAPAWFFGGPVAVAHTMVEDLLAMGHDVTVATTDAQDARDRLPHDTPPMPSGAEVLRFPNLSHRLATGAMAWQPRGYRGWVKQNVGRFDACLGHDFYSVISAAGAPAAAAAGTPWVLQPLGSLAPSTERGRPLLKRAFLAGPGRATLRASAAYVVSTRREREDFAAVGADPGKLREIPLPLDIPGPAPDTPRATVPTLVCVARLDPIKGIDRLLEALALARRSVPDLRLELIGPGESAPFRARAQRLGIADAVDFRGFISPEEKRVALTRAHAVCLFSRSEGLPLAAIEAMACGTPVVISEGTNLPEADEVAGVVFDGTPEAGAEAIVALMGDAALREHLGDGAHEFAARFDRAAVMPRMEALFRELA